MVYTKRSRGGHADGVISLLYFLRSLRHLFIDVADRKMDVFPDRWWTRINCAKEILDRVGIAKKDKVEITSVTAVPLFILPPKQKDEPDPKEV